MRKLKFKFPLRAGWGDRRGKKGKKTVNIWGSAAPKQRFLPILDEQGV